MGVAGISNVLGTVFPVKEIAAAAHANGALCLVDACQSVVHQKLTLRTSAAIFWPFRTQNLRSDRHRGLYGRYELLAAMPPYQTGGDMVKA